MASKYGNPRGKAATDAKRKYNSKNYDRIYPYVKKGVGTVAGAVRGRGSGRGRRGTGKGIKKAAGVAPVAFAFLPFRTVRMYSRRFRPA